ncbi:MAG: hypothetical protein KF724_02180 [Phycisphaeraceae bacterium]|nr:hypothetical protein [Phycisphaeraceae bacterium]
MTLNWDGVNGTWTVAHVSGANDEDRVTTYVYNGIGQLVKLTAIANLDTGNGDDQVTRYVYGVSSDPSGPDPYVSSSIHSNDLLLQIIYPEGEGSTTEATRSVYHGYNRQGEMTAMVDQNATLHEYERDSLGRMTRDTATATASNIDATIDRIDVSFDGAGRLLKVTSLESAGPTVRNEVEFKYTALGQVEKVYQHSKGAVTYDGGGDPTGDTRLVSYLYANDAINADSTGNYSRQIGLAYPRKINSSGHDPEVLEYAFGSAGGTDDRISRVNEFLFNLTSSSNTSMVNHEYVGLGRTILVDLVQPDVQLDFTLSPDGKRSSGVSAAKQTVGYYPGYDQFGRLALQTWADGALTSASSLPTKPQIVALQYGYDERGNRTSVYDVREGNQWQRSHVYTNDGLDRLSKARRNTWANLISGSPSDGVGTQAWALDLLGNWIDTDNWEPGSPPAPANETRTHNAVNELLTRVLPSSVTHSFTYDAAGNLHTDAVTSGATTIYTHDAWNRLLKVEVDDGISVETRLEQEFNGLTWRTLKREDTDFDGDLDEERTFTYDGSWRLLEERVDKDIDSDLDKRVQYVWGLRYIDDCLMHRADVNNDGSYGASGGEGTWYHLTDGMFSTVAVLDPAAAVVERVSYDAYGQARHQTAGDINGDGATDGADLSIVLGIGTKSIGQSGYRAEADLTRNGTVNSGDLAVVLGNWAGSLASGLISDPAGPDNAIGWDGYAFNAATADYIVRYRGYDPVQGRWKRHDPLGYIESTNLYQYAASVPLSRIDPFGQESSTACAMNPTLPFQAILAKLEAGAITQYQAAKLLAALGLFTAAQIAQLTSVSVKTADELLKLENLNRKFAAALDAIKAEIVALLLKQMSCQAAIAAKNRECGNRGGGNQPRSCDGLTATPRLNKTRDCTIFLERAQHFRRCMLARAAVLMLCDRMTDPDRLGHLEQWKGMLQGESKCMVEWKKCHDQNNELWRQLR